jgi:hypothetical protein
MSNVIPWDFTRAKCRECGTMLPRGWMIEGLCCHCGNFPPCRQEVAEAHRLVRAGVDASGGSIDGLVGCCEDHKVMLYSAQRDVEDSERIVLKGQLRGDQGTVEFGQGRLREAIEHRRKFLDICPECFALDAASRGEVQ